MHPLVCISSGYAVVVAARATRKYLDGRQVKELGSGDDVTDDVTDDDGTNVSDSEEKSLPRKLILLVVRSGLAVTGLVTGSVKSVTSAVRDEIDDIRSNIDNEKLGDDAAASDIEVLKVDDNSNGAAGVSAPDPEAAPA